jgi:Delta7-sterol 5-desaturase
MWPLYGGGFWVAFAQACMVYYTAATVLHLLVPAVVSVASVQAGKTKAGQEFREARTSIGRENEKWFF